MTLRIAAKLAVVAGLAAGAILSAVSPPCGEPPAPLLVETPASPPPLVRAARLPPAPRPPVHSEMQPGQFAAGSPLHEPYSSDENQPRPNWLLGNAREGSLYVHVFAGESHTLPDGADAVRVVIVNALGEPVMFNAADSRLRVIQEARDADGRWAPIEYIPSSSCGNSFHRLGLPAGQYWEFTVPRYRGAIATQLRIRAHVDDAGVIYSNVFNGSVNAAQFQEPEEGATAYPVDPDAI